LAGSDLSSVPFSFSILEWPTIIGRGRRLNDFQFDFDPTGHSPTIARWPTSPETIALERNDVASAL
jgi:hypothetical protein